MQLLECNFLMMRGESWLKKGEEKVLTVTLNYDIEQVVGKFTLSRYPDGTLVGSIAPMPGKTIPDGTYEVSFITSEDEKEEILPGVSLIDLVE